MLEDGANGGGLPLGLLGGPSYRPLACFLNNIMITCSALDLLLTTSSSAIAQPPHGGNGS